MHEILFLQICQIGAVRLKFQTLRKTKVLTSEITSKIEYFPEVDKSNKQLFFCLYTTKK